MKLRFALSLFILCFLYSCEWEPVVIKKIVTQSEQLRYEDKEFSARQDGNSNRSDSNSNFVKITYPFFYHQNRLNDSVKSRLMASISYFPSADTSFEQLTSTFFSRYKKAPIYIKKRAVYFTLSANAKILEQDSSLITVQIKGRFSNHNRPLTQIFYINWDTKQNRPVTLDDLFKNGYAEDLQHIGEFIFLQDEKVKDPAFLTSNHNSKYYFYNHLYLTNNYCLSDTGIVFVYNPGELKSDNMSPQELFIPYTEVKSILQPNSVVAQYIK